MHALVDAFLAQFDCWMLGLFPFFLSLYFIFGIDDLFLDFIFWRKRLGARELKPADIAYLHQLPEKRMALLVAAWQEEGVLKKMVEKNQSSLAYQKVDFFLGVYPNDPGTKAEALSLAAQYSNVRVTINHLLGPTSKGQMLNEVIQDIFAFEEKLQNIFEVFLIQDSEDVLHPLALKLINLEIGHADFIQLPIFSFPVQKKELISGTYVDEFSEFHTKDILVRESLRASIPSAGVGTALARRLVQNYLKTQNGQLFNSRSLTEDYELGVSTAGTGMRSKFSLYWFMDNNSRQSFIATREYFPRSMMRSIRQKTRWTFGIVFQGMRHLGWRGSLVQKYFLYRDRKGLIANLVVLFGSIDCLYLIIRAAFKPTFAPIFSPENFLFYLGLGNIFFMLNRMFQRANCVFHLYGMEMVYLIPVRIPITNLINAIATLKASYLYLYTQVTGTPPGWSKTKHELPEEGVARSLLSGEKN